MLEAIQDHLYDVLEAAAQTAVGFEGVRRVTLPSDAAAGYVNLLSVPFAPDSADARPAVYQGLKGREARDTEEFPAIGPVEYRRAFVPLVLVADGNSIALAKAVRATLLSNVRRVLLAHRIEAGFWYELRLGEEESRASSTGDAGTDVAQAHTVLTLALRYTRTPDTA